MATFFCSSLSVHSSQPKPFSLLPKLSSKARFPVSARPPPSCPQKSLRLSIEVTASDESSMSLTRVSCSESPQISGGNHKNATFLRSVTEAVAFIAVGAFLFLGGLNCRPAFALGDEKRSNLSAQSEGEEEVGLEEENEDDALEMYEKILQRSPSDVEALKVVLYGKMRQGKKKEAVKYVERLIKLEPDEVEWRLLQALCYELMGKLNKAKKLFRDILKERPLLLRALHGLALALHRNRETPAAFQMLNEALELAHRQNRVTEERNIKVLIAQMNVVKGDLEEASKLFQDLVNENPRDFRPYLCQGIIYSLLDKKEEADEQFEIYRRLIPDEFPQRSFIDDVILTAKAESHEQFEKEMESEE